MSPERAMRIFTTNVGLNMHYSEQVYHYLGVWEEKKDREVEDYTIEVKASTDTSLQHEHG